MKKKSNDKDLYHSKDTFLREGVTPLYIDDQGTADSMRCRIQADDFANKMFDSLEMSYFEYEEIYERICELRYKIADMIEEFGGLESLTNKDLAQCSTKLIEGAGPIRVDIYVFASKLMEDFWYLKVVEAQHRAFLRACGSDEPLDCILPKDHFLLSK